MKISSYILKFSGKVELPKELEISKGYKIKLDGEVRSATDSTNDDGTFNRTYKFAPIIGEVEDELGQITKTKDARSASKKMRACIRHEWSENKDTKLDEEEYYQQRMSGLIRKLIDGQI